MALTGITVNLLFWIPWLVVIALIKFVVRANRFSALCDRWVAHIYRFAVWFDTFLLQRCLGIEFEIEGEPPVDSNLDFIVLSNHRSWFDILLLQAIVVSRGPMLKFLVKQELIYVPVVGWICLVLNFPRLNRGKSETGRSKDYLSVASATKTPGALMNFVEGTRFTREKHLVQASPYKHLLTPRIGGLKIMLANQPQVSILDVTLVYPAEDLNFWACLSGRWRHFIIKLEYHNASEISDPQTWLTALWEEKDQYISQRLGTTTGD